MTHENNLQSANNFLDCNFSTDDANNLPVYSTTLDVMLLQHDLTIWKQAHNEATWEIEKLKNENSVLALEVSVWKARFLALRSGFQELDRKMRQILGSFEGWNDPV